MQIGEVIRKYRKIKNLTQEEMANRLGVTAPAVNKWENGNSLPDITLLAPIARLLDITLDSLLSYQEDLTAEEIKGLIYEANSRFKTETYGEVFQWAKKKLEMYPNSESLILYLIQLLDVQRSISNIPNGADYDKYILACYHRVLGSKDEDIKATAADALFSFYFRRGEYEKAEEYLAYFSKRDPERKKRMASIYSRTNRIQEAYQAYEELLFSEYQTLRLVFSSIYMIAKEEKDWKKAHVLVDKQSQLANLFEMGEYNEICIGLELAVLEQDVEKTLQLMERMLASGGDMLAFTRSPLYEHMTFKKIQEEFVAETQNSLVECFRDEKTFGFLAGDERWKKLVKPV